MEDLANLRNSLTHGNQIYAVNTLLQGIGLFFMEVFSMEKSLINKKSETKAPDFQLQSDKSTGIIKFSFIQLSYLPPYLVLVFETQSRLLF